MNTDLLDRIFHFLKTQRLGPSRAIPRDVPEKREMEGFRRGEVCAAAVRKKC
jgi:hypothetical protein